MKYGAQGFKALRFLYARRYGNKMNALKTFTLRQQ